MTVSIQSNDSPRWRISHPLPLGESSVRELLRADIPAIRVDSFASEDEMEALKQAYIDFPAHSQTISQVLRLGISQYQEGVMGSKEAYFARAAELRAVQTSAFEQSFDPTQRLIDLLRDRGFDADIMQERGFGPYYAGVVKSRNGYSPMHVDYAPQDSPSWEVGKATAQLAWNVYLDTPRGGNLLLWDKRWHAAHEEFRVPGKVYYSEEVVGKAPLLELPVHAGELVIINSRNFHAIGETQGRLAFGSFISYFPGNMLRFWS